MASKVFWITRDDEDGKGDSSLVFLWYFRDNPKKDEDGVFEVHKGGAYDLCYRGFKTLTGITLKPGERKKFRLVEV